MGGIDLEDSEVEQMATEETDDERSIDVVEKKPIAVKRKALSEGVLEDKQHVEVEHE